jgi:hypothetical protein
VNDKQRCLGAEPAPDAGRVRLANMDWPWKHEDPGLGIILVSDEQFVKLASHPDEAVEKIAPWMDAPMSLREFLRQGAARGVTKLRLAYDYFFGGTERHLYPDTETFQEMLKRVHDVAQEFGIGLEPSVLSPLELGGGYHERTGEAGRWMHYREGLRDPQTGSYSVMMWQHRQWCNNKGPTPVRLIGARAFAFREEAIPGTSFFAVDPQSIVELPTPQIEEWPGATTTTDVLPGSTRVAPAQFDAVRVRVWGQGNEQIGPLDRVLVVLQYQTMEMDYLSPTASEFLGDLVQQFHDKGISLAGVYSDEMHIQQDWSYHSHHDGGQFALRYVSPGFERAFAEQFGAQYADFARYMIYFCAHQHDFLPTHEPKLPSQHVFGPTQADIQATLLMRRQYYQFLEGNVVRLMIGAKAKAEQLNGHPLDAFYHSTWAESPTCDAWAVGGVHDSWSPEEHRRRYEYTPDFIWSNTVHQASAACANYFKWNDFLDGGNNDVPEGGYADRNYYGRVLACSLAALNRRPLPSAGMWGMPQPVRERMAAVSETYGAQGHTTYHSVQDYTPRQIEVLFVYPQDLVAVEERFGSWMVQYGYANLITAEKLLEHGTVRDGGQLVVKNSVYRTVCVLYEPFIDARLLDMLQAFASRGGSVIWSSVPPMLDTAGAEVRGRWEALFGLRLQELADPLGVALPSRQVVFDGALADVSPMSILTDFVVDRVFPVEPQAGSEAVAWVRPGAAALRHCVGTRRAYPGGGQAVYLGFRPRDDQAASTGVEVRTWFEILYALGAYPASGAFAENDNPSVISRTTEYLACAFPNGALAVCPHYRHHEESWPGGFQRDAELDARLMQENPVPDDAFALDGLRVAGQSVTYHGRHAVTWRLDAQGRLIAFSGRECSGISLNGQLFAWADQPVNIAWHPLGQKYAVPGVEPLYRVWVGSVGAVSVPLALEDAEGVEVWQGAAAPTGRRGRQQAANGRAAYARVGYGERQVPFRVADGALQLEIDDESCEHWLYVVRRKA